VRVLENGIRNPDGSWQRDANGSVVRTPDTVDPTARAIAGASLGPAGLH